MRAISACLLGLACRYDGCALPEDRRYKAEAGAMLAPVCPEQLGGLPTPRPPAQIIGGSGEDVLGGTARVLAPDGRDLTAAFLRGARETLLLCRCLGITEAILKGDSPSCGVGRIYRGTERVPGNGVTAALLIREGITVRNHPD